jgi:hypothetical protein
VSVNGTPVESKMCTTTPDYTHFIFNKCRIYTHDGASDKFSTNSHETDYSVVALIENLLHILDSIVLIMADVLTVKSTLQRNE